MIILLPGILFVDAYGLSRKIVHDFHHIRVYGFFGSFLFFIMLLKTNKWFYGWHGDDLAHMTDNSAYIFITVCLMATKSVTALGIAEHDKKLKKLYGQLFC